MRIPNRLINEIRRGDCVAFVGAGFSAPDVPQWKQLLTRLSALQTVSPTASERVRRLVENGRSKDLEAAAQSVRDEFDDSDFAAVLEGALDIGELSERMDRRLQHLVGIPFRAVLTTNFDDLLKGNPPGRDSYLDVLRDGGRGLWNDRYWMPGGRGPEVVQLHGSVSEAEHLVFTQRDYRQRLYGSPGYLTFLRSVMATTTVLYLGVSFTDAYLDEIRSEILALIGYEGTDQPIAYALLNDETDEAIAYAREHEGIEIIRYSSADNFEDFDALLWEIHDRTNPKVALGSLLEDSQIIWLDPSADANSYGLDFLRDAAACAGGRTQIHQFHNTEDALKAVRDLEADLVITHWGHGLGPSGSSTGEYFLSQVRSRDLKVPTIVFASGSYAKENKRAALSRGATAYEFRWDGLFREIERILTSDFSAS